MDLLHYHRTLRCIVKVEGWNNSCWTSLRLEEIEARIFNSWIVWWLLFNEILSEYVSYLYLRLRKNKDLAKKHIFLHYRWHIRSCSASSLLSYAYDHVTLVPVPYRGSCSCYIVCCTFSSWTYFKKGCFYSHTHLIWTFYFGIYQWMVCLITHYD